MKRLILILPLCAAACAAFGPPQPVEAKLSPDRLVVSLSNGEMCTGERTTATATATATGWTGKLTGCSEALPYEVSLDPRRNLVQGFVGDLFKLIGLDGLAANGQVRLTDATGHVMVFVSPKPTGPHDLH